MNKPVNRFFQWLGGRKQSNGYLFCILVTVAAFKMQSATFDSYAMWIAIALLGTSALVASEDVKNRAIALSQPSTPAAPGPAGYWSPAPAAAPSGGEVLSGQALMPPVAQGRADG